VIPGSAIIDVETQQVLALHFAGEYLKANYAIPMYELARDARVTAKKLNFDDTLTPTTDWEPFWLRTEATEATVTPAGSQPGLSSMIKSEWQATQSVRKYLCARSIAASRTQQGGALPAAPAAAPAEAEVQAGEEVVVINQDYSTRSGYDPEFLDGITVPLPKLTTKSMKSDTADSPAVSHHPCGDRFGRAAAGRKCAGGIENCNLDHSNPCHSFDRRRSASEGSRWVSVRLRDVYPQTSAPLALFTSERQVTARTEFRRSASLSQ
jgi:hypothetical protein